MVKQAFEDFYHDFKDKVYTHVYYRVGGNREVAADITSEVFLKAFKSFDSYDKKHAFSTWIFTITRNAIIDHYRKHKDTSNIDDYAEKLENDQEIIGDVFDREIDLAWLKEEIDNLPEKQRVYLSHRLFGGETVKEIATKYGAKQDAIRKNIQRATTRLVAAHKNRYDT
jgi:RNA polymerase sigma-70 factor, ECF subfamily